MRNPQEKIFTSLENTKSWREKIRKENLKLVVTNGCFDIMHRGHAEYLYSAAKCGDKLLVLVNSDKSVQNLKGPSRPVINEENRLYMLASLECVDAVLLFDDERATKQFEALQPDVYVKGADYSEETLNQEEYRSLKNNGAKFCFINFVDGCSTSNIVNKIIETEKI